MTGNDMALSPHEQRILAAIEDELGKNDSALVTAFATARPPSPVQRWLPVSARHLCLLILAHLTLIVVHSLDTGFGPAGSAMLTAPWIVIAARAARNDAPGSRHSARRVGMS
jgi:hypothetical protein